MELEFKIDPDNSLYLERFAPVQTNNTSFETCWSLPKDVGSGSIKKIEPIPGVVIFIADLNLKETLITSILSDKPAVGFGFLVSGTGWGKSPTVPCKMPFEHGRAAVLYFPEQSGTTKDMKNTNRRSVTLLVEPERFNRLLKGSLEGIPRAFRTFLDGTTRLGGYTRHGWITSFMAQALEQLFLCPLTGACRRLFFESKAMELIALRVSQLTAQEDNQYQPRELNALDIEAVHQVAARLRFDLENPPTLFELAASAGISHAKLNRGFRKVFGTTVFGYLRTLRLHRAKQMLEKEGLNVTETAMAVGYSSLSSFARAFFSQYGTTPNLCMRKKLG